MKVLGLLKTAIKYGALIYACIEVLQFAHDKFSNLKEFKDDQGNTKQ